MRTILRTLGLVFALALAAPAAAQEVQVALDEAGRIETIDLALAQRLGLWVDEYPGFREARLFQDAAGGYVLEITTQRGSQVGRQRVSLSAAEAEQLRRDISARLREHAPAAGLNHEGRYLLLGQTTLAGVLFYGWAVPYVLGMEDSGAAGMYLLAAGGSFFLPFALTQGRPVTYGMAHLSRYGVTRGILHGELLHTTLSAQEQCDPTIEPCSSEPLDGRASVASALAVSLVEGVGGYLWARNEEMSAGAANAIVTLGDAGLLWGLGTATVLELDETERAGAGLGLAGAAAGILGGRALAARRDYTWGDADLLYTAGLLGAYTGFALTAVADPEDERVFAAAGILGSAGMMYIADGLVRDTDYTVGQATLNRLGTIAGGLAGASLGVMAQEWKVTALGSALGALGGYLGTHGVLAPQAREQRGERFSSWDVQVSPHGLLSAAGAGERPALPAPVLSVRYRFGAR